MEGGGGGRLPAHRRPAPHLLPQSGTAQRVLARAAGEGLCQVLLPNMLCLLLLPNTFITVTLNKVKVIQTGINVCRLVVSVILRGLKEIGL